MRPTTHAVLLPGGVAWRYHRVQEDVVPQHPAIAAQPLSGQDIRFMYPYDGLLYVGYGDWNANTGPVSVIGYDLDTREPVTLLADVPTEAWDRCREFDGALYLPKTDPREGFTDPLSGGFATNEGGTWHVEACGPMIHTFDVIKWRGEMYTCGSVVSGDAGQGAIFRRSGGVWSEAHRGTEVANFARFYVLWEEDDALCTAELVGTQMRVWSTTDGETWTPEMRALDSSRTTSGAPVTPVTAGGYEWTYDPTTRMIVRQPLGGLANG